MFPRTNENFYSIFYHFFPWKSTTFFWFSTNFFIPRYETFPVELWEFWTNSTRVPPINFSQILVFFEMPELNEEPTVLQNTDFLENFYSNIRQIMTLNYNLSLQKKWTFLIFSIWNHFHNLISNKILLLMQKNVKPNTTQIMWKNKKKITKIFNVLQKHDFLFFFCKKSSGCRKKKTGDLFLHHTKTSRLFVWFSLTQNLFYFVTKKSFFLLSFLKNIEQNIIFDQNSNEKFMISRVKIGFFIFTISNQWDKITTFFFF